MNIKIIGDNLRLNCIGEFAVLSMMIIMLSLLSAHGLEIRGEVADGSFLWTPQNFAGFNYDIDQDLGMEGLATMITDRTLSGELVNRGIIFAANDKIKEFSDAKVGMTYGLLTVTRIDPVTGKIIMENKDQAITLTKNRTVEIIPGLYLQVADNDTLRYYIFKKVTEPGTYEIRGKVATTDSTWMPQNFAGFYYDIKGDVGTETLSTVLTDGHNLSGEQPCGLTYATTAQKTKFKFRPWGFYDIIGFLGKKYFAGYSRENIGNEAGVLYSVSTDKNSLVCGQLEDILIDEAKRGLIKKGESIELKEGYKLLLKGVNDEGKIYINLLKEDRVVDESFLMPSIPGATIYDQTYYYRKDIGVLKKVVIIAVHFLSTYKDEEQAIAMIDGMWQLSEKVIDVSANAEFGNMTVTSSSPYGIKMENKDQPITLERNIDMELMPGISIRTADNDTLRYYIYKTEVVS